MHIWDIADQVLTEEFLRKISRINKTVTYRASQSVKMVLWTASQQESPWRNKHSYIGCNQSATTSVQYII